VISLTQNEYRDPIKRNVAVDGKHYPIVVFGPDKEAVFFDSGELFELAKSFKQLKQMKDNQNKLIEQNKTHRHFTRLAIEFQKELVESLERSIMGLCWWFPNKDVIQSEIDKQKALVKKFEKQVIKGLG